MSTCPEPETAGAAAAAPSPRSVRAVATPLAARARFDELHVVIGVTVAGALLRAAIAWFTIDVPGDGATRAALAYAWARSPELIRFSYWPPGYAYLVGTVTMLIPDPRIAPRLVNIVLGSLSIPLLHVTARRVYGAEIALLAATVLALLPLHAGLSASSLSEPALVFAMLGVLASAFGATRTSPPSVFWIAAMLSFAVLAETVRYEPWVLVPLAVVYVLHGRPGRPVGLAMGIAVLAFPVFWVVQSHLHTGNALFGFSVAIGDAEGVRRAAPPEALRLLWRSVRNQVGTVAALIMVAACIDAAARAVRRGEETERVLYAATGATAWAVLFGYFLTRGPTVWSRLLILPIVLTIPLAVALVLRWAVDRRLQVAIAAVCVLSFAATTARYRPPIWWVTTTRQPQIEELASWLTRSRYRHDAIVLTSMHWRARSVPVYAPDLAQRALVVSTLETDEQIRRFVGAQRPSLLVTEDADAPLRARVEQLLGGRIGPQHLVTTIGAMQVFDIRHLATSGTDPH